MVRRNITIAIALFSMNWSGIATQQVVAAEKLADRVNCEPVGRVLSKGFLHFSPGSLLCKGDHLQVVNAKEAGLLCFANGQFVTVKDQLDAGNCGSTEIRTDCVTKIVPSCVESPELIRPYGNALIDGRPFLSWHPVKGATSYIVEVEGYNLYWQKTVKDTTMLYPSAEPSMASGNAYKVSVIAKKGDSVIGGDNSVFNILPETKGKKIIEAVEKIKSLNLPKDQEAYLDLDSVYMSRSLLNITINTLEARVKAGSRNPAVYRVLGERYLEAGFLDYAGTKFKTAAQLAAAGNDPVELEKAQAGVEMIKRYYSSANLPRLRFQSVN